MMTISLGIIGCGVGNTHHTPPEGDSVILLNYCDDRHSSDSLGWVNLLNVFTQQVSGTGSVTQ